jgi:hypothetical protein
MFWRCLGLSETGYHEHISHVFYSDCESGAGAGLSDPIDLTEVEPGKWMTRSQAQARRAVREAIADSDFTGEKWRFEQAISQLPLALRICVFLLFVAAAIGFFLGPLKIFAGWIFYS